MRGRLTAGFVAAVTVAVLGCSGDEDTTRPPPFVVDEVRGKVGDVSLGDDPDDIERAFGKAAGGLMAPRLPRGTAIDELGLPWTLAPLPGARRDRVRTMRYDGISFLVEPKRGAYAAFVWHRGAETRAGVRIGEELMPAAARYDGLRCDVRNQGTEYVSYPYCVGRIGAYYLWLGQDPIRSITVASTPLG
jgi:hypothetical protein